MKLIVCALYIEAKPLIQHYQLKPIEAPSGLQVFANDEIILTISGTGKVASACATAYALSTYPKIQNALNIGLCGSHKHKIGELLHIDQIIDNDTQRSFYSDIQKNTLQRDSICTMSKPVQMEIENWKLEIENFDMESSGFFESTSNFLNTHQIHILKVVSDYGCTGSLDKNIVETVLSNNLQHMTDFIDNLPIGENTPSTFTLEEETALETFKTSQHLSVSEYRELKKLVWNLKIQSQKEVSEILKKNTIQQLRAELIQYS